MVRCWEDTCVILEVLASEKQHHHVCAVGWFLYCSFREPCVQGFLQYEKFNVKLLSWGSPHDTQYHSNIFVGGRMENLACSSTFVHERATIDIAGTRRDLRVPVFFYLLFVFVRNVRVSVVVVVYHTVGNLESADNE